MEVVLAFLFLFHPPEGGEQFVFVVKDGMVEETEGEEEEA